MCIHPIPQFRWQRHLNLSLSIFDYTCSLVYIVRPGSCGRAVVTSPPCSCTRLNSISQVGTPTPPRMYPWAKAKCCSRVKTAGSPDYPCFQDLGAQSVLSGQLVLDALLVSQRLARTSCVAYSCCSCEAWLHPTFSAARSAASTMAKTFGF